MTIPGPLGDYTVFTKLNKGGMADVFLARPTRGPDRWVALKTLLPKLAESRKFVGMFHSEGSLGMMFDHPNIVRTLDVGKIEIEGVTTHYLAMEYVHGRDMGAVARFFRKENARMPIGQVLHIAQEVLAGLVYAHDLADESGKPLHLVNRDVSPANIMVGFDGRVRLIDFGIAQATMDFRSQIGSIRGKLSYMSPEQVRGLPVDGRSDLFSLSVVLYQLLTGVEPFIGEGEFEQMEKIRAAQAEPPSSLNHLISPSLEAIILKGLSRDQNDRFMDAGEMLDAVRRERARMESGYDNRALWTFMQRAFKGDIELLQARVNKAQAILRQSAPQAQDGTVESAEIFDILSEPLSDESRPLDDAPPFDPLSAFDDEASALVPPSLDALDGPALTWPEAKEPDVAAPGRSDAAGDRVRVESHRDGLAAAGSAKGLGGAASPARPPAAEPPQAPERRSLADFDEDEIMEVDIEPSNDGGPPQRRAEGQVSEAEEEGEESGVLLPPAPRTAPPMRRHPAWLPWLLLALIVAILGLGGLLVLKLVN